jgi:hypothetical protein
MKTLGKILRNRPSLESIELLLVRKMLRLQMKVEEQASKHNLDLESDRGDVPGWVLVVLMTTGLVTAIWTIAAPKLSSILNNSLNNMNNIR